MAKKTSPLLPDAAELLREFGDRLRLARLRRRLSAKHVCERAGMAPMTLRSLERGEAGVTIGAYLSVMQVLGLDKELNLLAAADPAGREMQDARLAPRAKKSTAAFPAPQTAVRKNPAAASTGNADAPGLPATTERTGLNEPLRLGRLYSETAAGAPEFEFDKAALANPVLANLLLDPGLEFRPGLQTPPAGQALSGMIADAGPGAWGRMLLDKARGQGGEMGALDDVCAIADVFRSGALRFRPHDAGDFSTYRETALPPFVQLRQLEAASLALEGGNADTDVELAEQALPLLIGAGGSLAGARPKATVADPGGHLWIAKFPSIHDAWQSDFRATITPSWRAVLTARTADAACLSPPPPP